MMAGGDNWWKQAVKKGMIPGYMHHKDVNGGVLVRPYGEKSGECMKGEKFAPQDTGGKCKSAFVRWEMKGEKRYLTVTSPDGDTYRFAYTDRSPVGTNGGQHSYRSSHQLSLKEQKKWPSGVRCNVETAGNFESGYAPAAVREVIFRQAYDGATRCFTSPMEKIPGPKFQPGELPVVAKAEPVLPPMEESPRPVEAPKPRPPRRGAKRKGSSGLATLRTPHRAPKKKRRMPPPPQQPSRPQPMSLDQLCKSQLPSQVTELWGKGSIPSFSDLINFGRGRRCGYLYQQSQKGVGGRHTPIQGVTFNSIGALMTLQVRSTEQKFEVLNDGARMWARHVDPDQWMIPPDMATSQFPHGTGEYGPIELRILKSGELLFRYLIPSNDGKDYIYAWAIARRGVEI